MTEGPNIFFWVGIVRVGIVLVSGELSAMGIVRDGNCPGGNRPQWELSVMGIVWVENVRLGIVLEGNFPGGNFSVGIVRWELSGGNCPGGNCPKDGNFPGANCLGVNSPGGSYSITNFLY